MKHTLSQMCPKLYPYRAGSVRSASEQRARWTKATGWLRKWHTAARGKSEIVKMNLKGSWTTTKKSLQKETRSQQRSSVTYDNAENDSAYHSHSRSGFPAVFCDNIVLQCVWCFFWPSRVLGPTQFNTCNKLPLWRLWGADNSKRACHVHC